MTSRREETGQDTREEALQSHPPWRSCLAAGKSTRMKSVLPKVAHEICGRPMVEYVLAGRPASRREADIMIVGPWGRHRPQPALGRTRRRVRHSSGAKRDRPRRDDVPGNTCAGIRGPVFVLAGDTPLLEKRIADRPARRFDAESGRCAIGTAITDANEGLGRIVRDAGGAFLTIVEQKDATPEQLKDQRNQHRLLRF